MERPSHIIFDTQFRSVSRRLPMIGLALSLQAAVLWLFTFGLVSHWKNFSPGEIHFIPIPDKPAAAIPPPEPHIPTRIEPPYMPPRLVNVPAETQPNTITATTNTAPVKPPVTVVAQPDNAPVAIQKTHTVPPYPPIARRIGAEGKVTLRLTVLADGRVGKAEVLNSSGRADLDETAQQWIVGHWTYRPASHDGQPTLGQTTATVAFSLTN
jgi:protein TonB